MIAVRVPVQLQPEEVEKLMLFGRRIDKELEQLLGRPALYAMCVAIDTGPAVVMHRMANTDIGHARQMFELASTTPIEDQFVKTLHEN